MVAQAEIPRILNSPVAFDTLGGNLGACGLSRYRLDFLLAESYVCEISEQSASYSATDSDFL